MSSLRPFEYHVIAKYHLIFRKQQFILEFAYHDMIDTFTQNKDYFSWTLQTKPPTNFLLK